MRLLDQGKEPRHSSPYQLRSPRPALHPKLTTVELL